MRDAKSRARWFKIVVSLHHAWCRARSGRQSVSRGGLTSKPNASLTEKQPIFRDGLFFFLTYSPPTKAGGSRRRYIAECCFGYFLNHFVMSSLAHLFCPLFALDPPQSTTSRLVCLLNWTKKSVSICRSILSPLQYIFYRISHMPPFPKTYQKVLGIFYTQTAEF